MVDNPNQPPKSGDSVTDTSNRAPLKNLSRFNVRHIVKSVIGENIKALDLANIIDATLDNPRGALRKDESSRDQKLVSLSKTVLSVKDDTSYIRKKIDTLEKKIDKLGAGGASNTPTFLAGAVAADVVAGGLIARTLGKIGIGRLLAGVAGGVTLGYLLATPDGNKDLLAVARMIDYMKKGKSVKQFFDSEATDWLKQMDIAAYNKSGNKGLTSLQQRAILNKAKQSRGQGPNAAINPNYDKRLQIIQQYQQQQKVKNTPVIPYKPPSSTYMDTLNNNQDQKNKQEWNRFRNSRNLAGLAKNLSGTKSTIAAQNVPNVTDNKVIASNSGTPFSDAKTSVLKLPPITNQRDTSQGSTTKKAQQRALQASVNQIDTQIKSLISASYLPEGIEVKDLKNILKQINSSIQNTDSGVKIPLNTQQGIDSGVVPVKTSLSNINSQIKVPEFVPNLSSQSKIKPKGSERSSVTKVVPNNIHLLESLSKEPVGNQNINASVNEPTPTESVNLNASSRQNSLSEQRNTENSVKSLPIVSSKSYGDQKSKSAYLQTRNADSQEKAKEARLESTDAKGKAGKVPPRSTIANTSAPQVPTHLGKSNLIKKPDTSWDDLLIQINKNKSDAQKQLDAANAKLALWVSHWHTVYTQTGEYNVVDVQPDKQYDDQTYNMIRLDTMNKIIKDSHYDLIYVDLKSEGQRFAIIPPKAMSMATPQPKWGPKGTVTQVSALGDVSEFAPNKPSTLQVTKNTPAIANQEIGSLNVPSLPDNGPGMPTAMTTGPSTKVASINPDSLVPSIGSSTSSADTTAPTPTGKGSATNNAKTAMDWFMSKDGGGFTRAQAAGIVGNMQGESGQGLNPRADNGLGFLGIAQWSRTRQKDFQRVMGKSVSDATVEDQLKFSTWELTDPSSSLHHVGTSLRNANTVSAASDIIFNQYESPGDWTGPTRAKYAENLYNAPTVTTPSPTDTASINPDTYTSTGQKVKSASLTPNTTTGQEAPTVTMPDLPSTSNRFSVVSGNLKGVNPKLINVMKSASRDLPPGYAVEMTSGHDARPNTHTLNHPNGIAMDVEIYHYVNGKKVVLPNEGFGPGLKMYEQLYQSVQDRGAKMYPKDKFIWGGGWVSNAAGVGDRMHYQIVAPIKGTAQGLGPYYDATKGFGPNSGQVKSGAAATPEELASYRAKAEADMSAEQKAAALTPDFTNKEYSDTGQQLQKATLTQKPIPDISPASPTSVDPRRAALEQEYPDDPDLVNTLMDTGSAIDAQKAKYNQPSTIHAQGTVSQNPVNQQPAVPGSINLAIAKTALKPLTSPVVTANLRTKSRLKTGGYPLDLPIGDPDTAQSQFA